MEWYVWLAIVVMSPFIFIILLYLIYLFWVLVILTLSFIFVIIESIIKLFKR